MFSPMHTAMDEREIEQEEKGSGGSRAPLEQDLDSLRATAFLGQSWATKAFGVNSNEGNNYRVSRQDGFYYVETVSAEPGKPAYGYSGVFVRECDLFRLTAVLVEAVRAKQKEDAGAK